VSAYRLGRFLPCPASAAAAGEACTAAASATPAPVTADVSRNFRRFNGMSASPRAAVTRTVHVATRVDASADSDLNTPIRNSPHTLRSGARHTGPMPAPPYGTPEPPHLAVRGEADLDVAPETAGIGITLTARGRDRRGVLDDLTRRNAEVLELVKSYGEAVEHLETGSLTVAPELTRHG